ncbi:uncharacterized protein LOC126739055 [Anthonomus grandis grandis]|uniref:uncharacterized protein LOC126739055 n=1 Tax=Anthonomus grandis grandis TaxID=2921223 RepID=UPI0021667582|nr:uncharacterized protein LOC126739055 [Anthonomus grandis grandis]
MAENRKSKKRKLQELLQELLEESSDSDVSIGSQSDDEDAEMTCPLATLSKAGQVQPPNGLWALLEKKTPENLGPEVHSDISELLSVFLSKGLDAEGRKITLEQYPILKGCEALKPPEINPEIKSCVTSAILRQDMFLSKLQSQLAAAISALAVPLNITYEKLKKSETPSSSHEELEKLGDPMKLVADAFHSLSKHRRYLMVPCLDDAVKDVLETCSIDSFLFGQNFTEKLKCSSEAKKLGASIKKKPKIIRTGTTVPTSSRRPLSSKQAAGSSRRNSQFFQYRQRSVKPRYRKEEEGRHNPRKRQYQH